VNITPIKDAMIKLIMMKLRKMEETIFDFLKFY
jgi:hypothetical protein